MSFNILYDCKYFIAAHALFPELANKVDNFFACHSITCFLKNVVAISLHVVGIFIIAIGDLDVKSLLN